MTLRMKSLLGASALALLSGAAPAIPAIMAPAAVTFGAAALADLIASPAEAQESGEEGGDSAECTSGEEGEEGGDTACPPVDGSGEDGEGG